MKALILLVPLLAVVAAKTCDCDFSSRAVICKGLSFTDFHKKDSGCEHAFWKIDFSENSLQEFPNDLQQFRKVNLSQNSLEHLESSVNQNVQYLDVSKNNILKINLENKFLSLRHLIAANNYLGLLDDFLDGQCNIEHLDVSGNKIKTLDAVTRCAHLSILEASDNRISHLPKKLAVLSKLQVLHLSRNNIKDVSGLPTTLEILDLSLNNIQRVGDSSFRGLTSLHALDLSGNNLSPLEKHAFATLSSLQSLRLRGNNLKFVSRDLFKGLKSLRGLELAMNPIEFLSNDTFSDLSALEGLYLESNEISTLPALQLGRKVTRISLSGNAITKMDHSALLTLFSGTEDERFISLIMNNFRGDDPEWSNVLKYFDGQCSPINELFMLKALSGEIRVTNSDKYTLAPSPCACVVFTKGNWKFDACIADGAEMDGLPWLEAAETYARVKEEGRHTKRKRDEF